MATLTVLRERLGRELDLMTLITNADFDSAAAGSITSANMLRDTNRGGSYYQDQGVLIFRPGAASAADYIRYAGALTNSSGLLAHTGANYADTTVGTEVVELWKYGIRPTRELVDALNRVLEFEFVTTHVALSHLSPFDGDMALATDTDWTDVGTPTTSAKSITAALVPWGMRSYELVGDATNEGTRSTGIRIRQGGQMSAFAIAIAETGTASLQPYDNTNSAAYGTAVTSSERRAQLLAIQSAAVPSTCKLTSLNLLGTTNPSDIYWNQAWLYDLENLTCRYPATITEGFMAPVIFQARPTLGGGSNAYDAGSLDLIALKEGLDYWHVFTQGDAQPYKVRFASSLPTTGGHPYEWPLFVEARRPASDLTTFSETESATTSVAVHNLLPRWKLEVLKTILLGKIPADRWKVYYDQAERELVKAQLARAGPSLAEPRPYYAPRTSIF